VVTKTLLVKKKKKKNSSVVGCNFLLLGVMVGLICGSQNVMWWPAKLQRPSKKKKNQPFDDCIFKTLICGHRLNLLFLFLEWPAYSIFSDKFQRSSDRRSDDGSVSLFCSFSTCFLCHRRILLVAGQFLHFPASLQQLFIRF
jgi:hypothetical protein